MAQVPNSALYAYQDGLIVTAAQLNQDIQVLQTALNDNYYRLLRSVTVNGTAFQLQGTSGIINNINLNTDTTATATGSADAQGNITVTFGVAAGSIGTTQIANSAVGTAQLADLAVTQSKIANQAVGTTQIANNAVGVNQLDPSLVQQTGINLVQAKLAEAVLGLRNLLHPSQQSFTRASSAWRINGSAYVSSNVLRTEQGKFGQGAFIEEATMNLIPNSGFETVTTTATVFSDALTSYSGSTVPAPWTLQSGSFTFGASGATSSATGSMITAGNAQWKPLLGSDGITNVGLTHQVTFTTPSAITAGTTTCGKISLFTDANNQYETWMDGTNLKIGKIASGQFSQLNVASLTLSTSTQYTMIFSIDHTGLLTAKVWQGANTSGTLLQTLTATDTSLTGGFLIGVGGDTGVVISQASCVAPWANGWTIGGDQRVAWGLTSNAVSGKYAFTANMFSGNTGGWVNNSANISANPSTNYTVSAFLVTQGITGTNPFLSQNYSTAVNGGAYISKNDSGGLAPNSFARLVATAQTPSNAGAIYVVLNATSSSGTVTFDNIQLEQKPYATTYVEVTSASAGATATRSADSLSYNLSNPLPSNWFGALVWKPQLASNVARSNNLILLNAMASGVSRYFIQYIATSGKFELWKSKDNGTTLELLDIASPSFNSGDSVFIAWVDNQSAGTMSIWISVNGGAIQTKSMSTTQTFSDVKQLYIGSGSSSGWECDGTIDFPIISDVIPTSDQITSLANATDWGGMRDWGGALPDNVRLGQQTQIRAVGGNTEIDAVGQNSSLLLSAPFASYLMSNLYFDGTNFNRYDTNKGGRLVYSDPSVLETKVASAPAGANPATLSYTTLVEALSGGYKVQSGQVSLSNLSANTQANQPVTFPSSFTANPLVYLVLNGVTVQGSYTTLQVGNLSANGFTAYAESGSAQTSLVINWIAIGQ